MNRFLAALRFLTIVPVGGSCRTAEADLAGSVPFFPVVGLLLGAVAAGVAYGLSLVAPPLVSAAVLIVLMLGFSGGLHMDGLSDMADGFLSSRPQEKVLEIMKDSRVGAMGVIAVVAVMLLKFAALASVPRQALWAVAMLTPLAGRCAMVVQMAVIPYVRPTGLGSVFARRLTGRAAIGAVAVLALAGGLLLRAEGVLVAAAVVVVALAISRWCRRRIGGATGDTYGATCETAELVPALLLAILPAVSGGCSSQHPPARDGKQRIVSLAPSVTEMLFELGLGARVVGATSYCNYPEAARRIERVGGIGSPNFETLMSLRPDLVITMGMERSDLTGALQSAGVHTLKLDIRSFEDVFRGFEEIGRATSSSRQAAEIVSKMRADLKATGDRYRQAAGGHPLRVFVELWDDPITTVSGSSFLDEVIAHAGGVNVAHELAQQYPMISPEKVIDWNPDAIVLCYKARGAKDTANLARRIGWADISAVRHGRIIADLDNDLILKPGPRLVQGVRMLGERFYGTPAEKKAGP